MCYLSRFIIVMPVKSGIRSYLKQLIHIQRIVRLHCAYLHGQSGAPNESLWSANPCRVFVAEALRYSVNIGGKSFLSNQIPWGQLKWRPCRCRNMFPIYEHTSPKTSSLSRPISLLVPLFIISNCFSFLSKTKSKAADNSYRSRQTVGWQTG